MATKRSKKSPADEPARVEIDTFRPFDGYASSQCRQDEPSCFNGIVRVRRWRIVAELVDEPVEVIAERLRKLWRESDNHHHWEPLKRAAASVGVELGADEFGAFRRSRTNGN